MRLAPLVVVGTLIAVPAIAHDFWLQPRSYTLPIPGADVLSVLIGHGPDRQHWPVGNDHVVQFVSFGPSGKTDRKNELTLQSGTVDGLLRFAEPGTHLLAFQSTVASSNLPAIRYNGFAQAEGLTIPLTERARLQRTGDNGRELYARRAKAIVQVGPVDPRQAALVTRRLGLNLEIVPERNPLTLEPGQTLPVRVYFDGQPLGGALVKLTNLGADAKPVELHRSDAQGRAVFSLPNQGTWLINVIWSTRLRNNPAADYQTVFSSLTFGYPARPPSK